MVAAVIKNNFSGHIETPDPRTLMTLVKRKAGVEVSYSTDLRGKHRAVHDLCGTLEECYKYVFSYLYMLEQLNPGSKTSMLLDGEKRFKYLFFSELALKGLRT